MAFYTAIVEAIRQITGRSGSTIGLGPTWEPEKDPRILGYHNAEAIFDGRHVDALHDLYKFPPETLHVVANYPRLICTIPSDLMLGEPFTVDYPDDSAPGEQQQKAITDIITRSQLHTTAYEASVDCSWAGDQLLLAERDDDGKAWIRPIRPDIWFPEANPDDVRDILVHRLAWIRQGNSTVRPKTYLRMVEHHKGEIRNRLFVLREKKVEREVTSDRGAWADLYAPDMIPEPVVETGIDDFLLVHIPNGRKAKDYFGRTDFADLKSLFAAVDARYTQNNRILEQHADPSMAVPEEMWKWMMGQASTEGYQGMVDPKKLKASRMGPNGEKPEYITWDGQITDSLAFVQDMKNTILQLSEIDRQLVGEGDQANLSGRALRTMLVRTLGKVNRKWKYHGYALERALTLAAALEGIEVESLDVNRSDGLPADTMEDIQASVERVNAGLSSRLREIMRLEDLDEGEARALLREIEKEQDDARNSEALANAVNNPPRQEQRRNPIEVRLG